MDKGLALWVTFAAIFAVGLLISHVIKSGIEKNGIETEAVVSSIVDISSQEDIDLHVYVCYCTKDGRKVEGVLSNPRANLEEGQRVKIKYHPKHVTNARLV